ncbi:hypothetical protein [Spirosoma gilvum]
MKTRLLLLLLAYFIGFGHAIHAEDPRQTNMPSKTTSRTPVPTGPSVVGEFHGRIPCSEIAKDWKITVSPECWKVKWALILYQDPVTHLPTTYHLKGSLNRSAAREGKWAMIRGIKNDPNAIVYQLDSDKADASIYLLKGDDDILFILDQQRNLRVGNENVSYTLNRVIN